VYISSWCYSAEPEPFEYCMYELRSQRLRSRSSVTAVARYKQLGSLPVWACPVCALWLHAEQSSSACCCVCPTLVCCSRWWWVWLWIMSKSCCYLAGAQKMQVVWKGFEEFSGVARNSLCRVKILLRENLWWSTYRSWVVIWHRCIFKKCSLSISCIKTSFILYSPRAPEKIFFL